MESEKCVGCERKLTADEKRYLGNTCNHCERKAHDEFQGAMQWERQVQELKPSNIGYWCGRPIEELTREELIEVISELYASLEDERGRSADTMRAIGGLWELWNKNNG